MPDLGVRLQGGYQLANVNGRARPAVTFGDQFMIEIVGEAVDLMLIAGLGASGNVAGTIGLLDPA